MPTYIESIVFCELHVIYKSVPHTSLALIHVSSSNEAEISLQAVTGDMRLRLMDKL